ncbi:MAG TPA: metallophosphoesterase family protein [Myxococcota bacterium]|jgi:diadenosine tetraphosphatase ApaH/serine/threonine PP2A family protein phosphatase|nr:metallophosphoesterase family protein [Myxococcota bacterium]
MLYGIFSDTHANVEALRVVLTSLEGDKVDRYVCLGDTVGYGASPNECCDLIRSKAAFTIMGNHDAAVAGRMDYSYYYEAARQALDWHASILTEDNMRWLRSLVYVKTEAAVMFCHGSPLNLEEFEYIFAVEQARELCAHYAALSHVTFIGHSHLCKVFEISEDDAVEIESTTLTLRPDRKYIISVGSVGQPRDYDPRSCYVRYDTDSRSFCFNRVDYDIESAARKILEADLSPNFGHRLRVGV